MDFIGAQGSRSEPVADLVAFLGSDYPDFRVVQGVFKIGKSCTIDYAYNVFKKKRRKASLVWMRRDYAALSIKELVEVLSAETGYPAPPRPKSNLAGVKSFGEQLDWIARVLSTDRKVQDAERLVIWVSVSDVHGSHEHLSRIIFSSGLGRGRCICKVILEQRTAGGALMWQVRHPEINRVLELAAFRESEAKDLMKSMLREDRIRSAGEAFVESLSSVLITLCGRHPELLARVCRWIIAAIARGDEDGSMAEWRAEELEQRILAEIMEHHQQEIEDIIGRLSSCLPSRARSFFEQRLAGGYVSGAQVGIEEGVLRFVGLVSKDGTIPQVVSKFYRLTGASLSLALKSEEGTQEIGTMRSKVESLWKKIFKALSTTPGNTGNNDLAERSRVGLLKLSECMDVQKLKAIEKELKDKRSGETMRQQFVRALEQLDV